jgi:adenine-specific DNA-methyltransferase
VRFAEPRYEAVGKPVQRAIDQSKKHPTRVIVLERAAHKRMIFRGGNRLLFLADKTRELDGQMRVVEPLTTVWSDVPFQGIAREGGVVFVRNKKPERLLMRILAMTSDPGDWVLDPYLGSGTTAAVAHKMGRRWIGIEEGSHALEMARERLVRVVRGEDPTGITKAQNFQGGGGFGVYR